MVNGGIDQQWGGEREGKEMRKVFFERCLTTMCISCAECNYKGILREGDNR